MSSTRRARLSRVARGRFVEALLVETGRRWPDLEGAVAAIYAAHVRPGDTVLDAGVNHGTHLFPLAELVGPTGHVVGVEAVPAFAAHVRSRLDGDLAHLRDRVTLHEVAVSATPGEAAFYVTGITDGGMSGLCLRPEIAGDAYARIVVPVTTIDALIEAVAPIRFAKLDIEGAEYDALRGAPRLLAARPLIVFEFDRNAPAQFGFDADDLLGLFARHGYCVFDIFGFQVVDGATMLRAMVWNFVAVPSRLAPAEALSPAQRRLSALLPALEPLLPAL